MPDVQLSIILPADKLDALDAFARRRNLTRSAVLCEALADFLDLHGDADILDDDAVDEPGPVDDAPGFCLTDECTHDATHDGRCAYHAQLAREACE